VANGQEAGKPGDLEAKRLGGLEAKRLEAKMPEGREDRMLGGDIWKIDQVSKFPSFLAFSLPGFLASWPTLFPAFKLSSLRAFQPFKA